ncbi:MAG TPA: flagellar filament capping protein FliD [Pirellulaceae bacterium]|jgi:flagellar hook-associated protein 2|nr:flagellar filament capping protein FliD [Pirellulaceae bacterium]
MGRIQTNIGLITGTPIAETVNQLIALSAQPRDTLKKKNALIQNQQVAIAELTSLTIGVKLAVKKFGSTSSFQGTAVKSSNSSSLQAQRSGTPSVGSYSATPLRNAAAHQAISQALAAGETLPEGKLVIRSGPGIAPDVALEGLNGGAGVERGKIRITDRSGETSTIDLRGAVTLQDVAKAINEDDDLQVEAAIVGDALKLTDLSGGTSANLRVQEVSGGKTAAQLGLLGIDVAATEATGTSLSTVTSTTRLASLRSGAGVHHSKTLADLRVAFRDGTTLDVEIGEGAKTVGDVLKALNAADPTKLQASISGDGKRIVLTDLTADDGKAFSVASLNGTTAAEDLGIAGAGVAATLTGERIASSVSGPLLSSLKGGDGLGTLGSLRITDKAGAVADIDLSGAETLDDVIRAIKDADVAVEATWNDARTGVVLRDVSGGAGSLKIESLGGSETAETLGIDYDGTDSTVDSGSLDAQSVFRSTSLATYARGAAVPLGSFLITDSQGKSASVNFRTSAPESIGDVIDHINTLSIGVEARINETGDGILLVDTAGGSKTLTVTDEGTSTTAKALGIAGIAESLTVDGVSKSGIDGSTAVTFDIEDGDDLTELATQWNDAKLGIRAAVISDGQGGKRLSLTSEKTGLAGAFRIEGDGVELGFSVTAQGQDSALLMGSAAGAGFVLTSSTDTFESAIDGLKLTVGTPSTTPVTVTVEPSSSELMTNLRAFVNQYNKLRDKLASVTSFNPLDGSTGVLFGSGETLRIDSGLSSVLTARVSGAGDIKSLRDVGIDVDDKGKISLDEEKFTAAFAERGDEIVTFFTQETTGFSVKMTAAVDRLAGEKSALISKTDALQSKFDTNVQRIDFMTKRLDVQRNRLLTQFYSLEQTISKMQSNSSALSQIQPISFDRR